MAQIEVWTNRVSRIIPGVFVAGPSYGGFSVCSLPSRRNEGLSLCWNGLHVQWDTTEWPYRIEAGGERDFVKTAEDHFLTHIGMPGLVLYIEGVRQSSLEEGRESYRKGLLAYLGV